MKKIFTLLLLSSCFLGHAQIGIKTDTPGATLDVNGNVIVRTVNDAAVAGNYNFAVIDPTNNEIKKVNRSFVTTQTANATYSSSTNTTISKAVKSSGFTLLNVSLFDDWQKIDFTAVSIPATGGNFDTSTDFYTVPSNGIYEINYYVRYGTGVQAALLAGGNVKIGILKQDLANTNSLLDQRAFAGVNLYLASITISTSEINSVYQLSTGDKISFAIDQGNISLGLLGTSYASFVIKKISN